MVLKNKKILIIFIVTLLVSVFYAVAVILVNKHNEKSQTEKPRLQVSAFEGSGTSGVPYLIQNKSDLTTFADNVSGGEKYSGKYFKLTSNINLGGEDFGIEGTFNGTFDGNGFSIKNYRISAYNFITLEEPSSSEGGDVGINFTALATFYNLGPSAVIKNLKICDIKSNGKNNSIDMYVDCNAGLCISAANGAIIKNCIVENFTTTVNKDNQFHNNYFAGIILYGSPTIQDCVVNNISTNITKSKVKVSIGPVFNGYYGDFYYSIISSDDISIESCVVNNNWGLSLTNLQDNITNCKTEAYEVDYLDFSSKGGVNGSIWYYSKDYNDGWPMLRVFMKNWKDVNIYANPSTGANPSLTTIQIPSGESKNYKGEILDDGKEARIVIYDQEVIIKANERYKFTEWECHYASLYYVYLEEIKFKIIFGSATIETPEGIITIEPINETLEVSFGETLQTQYSYGSYLYKWENGSMGMAVLYNLSGYNKYTIESWNLPNGEESWVVGEDYTGTDYTIYITPTFKLKEYGWIFM